MKPSTALLLPLAIAAVTAIAAAQTMPSQATAGAASASASASAALPAPPPRAPRRFLEGFPGAEKSPRPSPEDWGKAEPLEISRPNRACKAFRIREYVRVTCLHSSTGEDTDGPYIYGARVIAGAEDGVEVIKPVWEPPRKFGQHGIDIVIPVRPGDRRQLAIATATPVWKSMNPDEGTGLGIAETWLPGDPGPTIVIH